MKFGTRSSPRVKVVVGCLRSELVDEMMSSVAKTPIRGESDRFEVDVELLVGDDFVGVAALVVGVDVGGGTTGCLTRRVVDVSVDGGVRDADVQNRFAFVVEVRRSQVSIIYSTRR